MNTLLRTPNPTHSPAGDVQDSLSKFALRAIYASLAGAENIHRTSRPVVRLLESALAHPKFSSCQVDPKVATGSTWRFRRLFG
eukprot:COSAG04_NODE_23349_length_340_cov_0.643154_1_plen_82_part_01